MQKFKIQLSPNVRELSEEQLSLLRELGFEIAEGPPRKKYPTYSVEYALEVTCEICGNVFTEVKKYLFTGTGSPPKLAKTKTRGCPSCKKTLASWPKEKLLERVFKLLGLSDRFQMQPFVFVDELQLCLPFPQKEKENDLGRV